ncbi:TetR/AcrR family transcriptional regulator [Pelagibius sp.]|uniref:TetR/AcrR family transcriptional regulator n=1 Tax=Pelagibius sp. TaxID=1931238 RepID=UPI0026095464|nr:TetR/AcrR family transcriptional regulator [Pelagibius sp.]
MGTRDRILEAADALFYAGSIREVSVERVAEQAGVTKKTLYYHFRSKDDLVAAYLDARQLRTLERYQNWAGSRGAMAERMERMFAALAEAAKQPEWRGCGFIRAAVELADSPGHPALDVARSHKESFETWLQRDLENAGYADAASLARMILVLLDGAVARMLVHRNPDYALEAGRAASLLLQAAESHRLRSTG